MNTQPSHTIGICNRGLKIPSWQSAPRGKRKSFPTETCDRVIQPPLVHLIKLQLIPGLLMMQRPVHTATGTLTWEPGDESPVWPNTFLPGHMTPRPVGWLKASGPFVALPLEFWGFWLCTCSDCDLQRFSHMTTWVYTDISGAIRLLGLQIVTG